MFFIFIIFFIKFTKNPDIINDENMYEYINNSFIVFHNSGCFFEILYGVIAYFIIISFEVKIVENIFIPIKFKIMAFINIIIIIIIFFIFNFPP